MARYSFIAVFVAAVIFGLDFQVRAQEHEDPPQLVSILDLVRSKSRANQKTVANTSVSTPASMAVAVLYTDEHDAVVFMPQLGLKSPRSLKRDTNIEVTIGPFMRFLEPSRGTIFDLQNDQKTLTFRPGKIEWLAIAPPPLKKGSLGQYPSYSIWANQVLVQSATREEDLIRNEYIASAFELGSVAAATGIYGPRWKGPQKQFVEFLKASEFSTVDAATNSLIDLQDSNGPTYTCEVGGTAGFAYSIYPDVDHRLVRAKTRVMAAVVKHFSKLARRQKLNLSKDEVAALFRVSSGYRNPARNRCVGGDPFSRHQWGLALDLSFRPDSTHAAEAAKILGMHPGQLWQEYRDVAARAVSSEPLQKHHCKEGRLRAPDNPQSRFSAYPVFCGCEGAGEFMNCQKDAELVDHVHLGF